MTDLLPMFPAFSPEESIQAQETLWRLLRRQARLYAPDSASLPVETAAALAESILLTLGADRDPSALLRPTPEERFSQGQRRLRQKAAVAHQLCQSVSRALPEVENRSLTDTLNSLLTFQARYDWRFFAQEIPVTSTTSSPNRCRRPCGAWTTCWNGCAACAWKPTF